MQSNRFRVTFAPLICDPRRTQYANWLVTPTDSRNVHGSWSQESTHVSKSVIHQILSLMKQTSDSSEDETSFVPIHPRLRQDCPSWWFLLCILHVSSGTRWTATVSHTAIRAPWKLALARSLELAIEIRFQVHSRCAGSSGACRCLTAMIASVPTPTSAPLQTGWISLWACQRESRVILCGPLLPYLVYRRILIIRFRREGKPARTGDIFRLFCVQCSLSQNHEAFCAVASLWIHNTYRWSKSYTNTSTGPRMAQINSREWCWTRTCFLLESSLVRISAN